ncbi:hypothetical protein L1987_81147 [Smallanthus sonchifolius]|uniref:Uncharacterized protein n=1 Tax=Smallanthus sonchifolius TaxID=185202 RepID=A0ACB8YQD2_9ASTR|nr:hypothetical protein L1987_81147 [Smallanthus sonchifolius]
MTSGEDSILAFIAGFHSRGDDTSAISYDGVTPRFPSRFETRRGGELMENMRDGDDDVPPLTCSTKVGFGWPDDQDLGSRS